MMADFWFKPRRYGYGATPVNWRGWLAVGVLAVLDVGLTVWLMLLPTIDHSGPSLAGFVVWVATTCIVTLAFVAFSKTKTDGEWRWRWGEKD
jgi:hypothetical protein